MDRLVVKQRRALVAELLDKYPSAWDWRNMPEEERTQLLAEAVEMGLTEEELRLRITQMLLVRVIAIESAMSDCDIREG
jgi:hypothetical protein